nr:MAG TPA: hypothetical protein [Caudoviricetes sp.]
MECLFMLLYHVSYTQNEFSRNLIELFSFYYSS